MGIEKPAIKTVAGFFHCWRWCQSGAIFCLDGFFFCTLLALVVVQAQVLVAVAGHIPRLALSAFC